MVDFLGSYKVIPKRNYYGAYGYATNPKTQNSAGRKAQLKRKLEPKSQKKEAVEFWCSYGVQIRVQGLGFRVLGFPVPDNLADGMLSHAVRGIVTEGAFSLEAPSFWIVLVL